MDELQKLIHEQAEEMRYGNRVWLEPHVVTSLDKPINGGGSLSDFVSNKGWIGKPRSRDSWSCPLHGRSDTTIDATGQPRCRACHRDVNAQYRRRQGMAERKYGLQCGHEGHEKYSKGKRYCGKCKAINSRRWRERTKATDHRSQVRDDIPGIKVIGIV